MLCSSGFADELIHSRGQETCILALKVLCHCSWILHGCGFQKPECKGDARLAKYDVWMLIQASDCISLCY